VFYSRELTIPPQTTVEAPYVQTLALARGVIAQLWVRWYYGSGNLCGVRFKLNEFAYWPMTLGEWIPSSVYPLAIPENYTLQVQPMTLRIEAFNLDDVFAHGLWVAVAVLRAKKTGQLDEFLTWIAGQSGA